MALSGFLRTSGCNPQAQSQEKILKGWSQKSWKKDTGLPICCCSPLYAQLSSYQHLPEIRHLLQIVDLQYYILFPNIQRYIRVISWQFNFHGLEQRHNHIPISTMLGKYEHWPKDSHVLSTHPSSLHSTPATIKMISLVLPFPKGHTVRIVDFCDLSRVLSY